MEYLYKGKCAPPLPLPRKQTGQTELTLKLDLVTSVPKAPVHTFLKNKRMTLDARIFVICLLLLCLFCCYSSFDFVSFFGA